MESPKECLYLDRRSRRLIVIMLAPKWKKNLGRSRRALSVVVSCRRSRELMT
jgi:hypothetical protein